MRRAGADGGALSARGAGLLGLPQGIPVAPAEGDQPSALAGSLIAAAGTVAMSFGTSVVANAVGDRPFQGVDRAIDHFCAPDGKPINMVWLRNGTTAMNMVVEMFGRVAGGADAFATVIPQLLAAPDDCGGLQALPFMDDEPGAGVSHGGTALVIGLNDVSAALMAKYRDERLAGQNADWSSFLAGHASSGSRRFEPRSRAAATFDRLYARHKRLVAIQGELAAAIDAG